MENVNVSGTIQAPANDVWNVVSDFGALDQFVEAIKECESDGTGVGAVRTLTLQDGAEVKEKLESLDDQNQKLTYSILSSPLPVENYTGTIQIREKGDNKTEFSWSSTFKAKDNTADEMKETFEGLYNFGVEGLQKHFS
ncbi:MAG: SRPBCC family protein [Bacteroidetes bacterium]|jgi:hypothetical protein|nr:SRPBCC family protein [Bacteroidota bacterium]